MTTKPRARKFRVRRSATQQAAQVEMPVAPSEEAAEEQPMPATQAAPALAPAAGDEDTSDRAARRKERLARAAERRAKTAPADGETPIPTSPEEETNGLEMMAEAAPTPAAEPAKRGTTAPPSSMPAAAPVAAQLPPEQEIAQIRQEGLTGRQLRMARRLAQKHGLAATSDYDAVRLLRSQGLDPFRRANMLDMAAPDSLPAAAGAAQLPQTRPAGSDNLPSMEMASPAERRVREIGDIQKDIARRRRRKSLLMLSRLAAFVMLPTILAGYYYYNIATPMYSTKSEFLIIQSEQAGTAGGLLSGSQFDNKDSISTQSYLQSKEAMLRLEEDIGFKAVFSDPSIDPLQRLAENPSNEQAYKMYNKYVKIGFDPTEGVIRMEVSSPDPQTSTNFSKALIAYAEETVDGQSQRKREDQLKDARRSLEKAKQDRRDAQLALVSLQETSVLDPEGLIASLRQQISTYELELQENQLELSQLLDNARPNTARVNGVRGNIRNLQAILTNLESRMTDIGGSQSSLAGQAAAIQIAQADLATADLILQSALQTVTQTELEASRQVRYLTTSVSPIASEDPSFPRSFENTILSFLIFSGLYLMVSLTASILREQVSG
ncbi:capsule biosynthesis protein [Cognatishimia sp. 1_MG-2023]|uniref:capsule biosynthesis protein n=1 Tax=Cognatishimia sp. 1_MG-2023 TaxID=3062642 RepID=UPI0026E33607|nr:capsule biosynthesis protein [Cognatishimia sp. 1_MG-2023]MDO6726184.1 capsule biosynthesis protein [Cognatishimia sp. 1_MG-2023]